ncbi:MAG: polyamine aminopropyltransferase [Rhodospirillaceae bacterium]|nr:polyamine aminopropyltransferase [Rhodospirillaceae bacterium]
MDWFDETLHDGIRQSLTVDRLLHREHTGLHDLAIFENRLFGRVLALDGAIQTTEADEYVYHEMLAHPAILARKAALFGGPGGSGPEDGLDVLIVGGGDGGCLREALRHPEVRATQVEIDPRVVELAKAWLPALSAGAFDDPRAELVIADGARFVAETGRRFDVAIIDSTDPVGPGAALFTADFYRNCKRCLKDGGVLITQNGVPALQADELAASHAAFRRLFADPAFYLAPVPTYNGGFMAFGWATDDAGLRRWSGATIRDRIDAVGLKTRYFNADIFTAAFALPNDMRRLLRA